jgi:hypothetical protein
MSLSKGKVREGQRRSHILGVASYGQPTALIPPSSEVTKCDTNASPRRLVTHLLQQVDQSFTSRRHRGHGSANATRNNTNTNDHTTIAKASIASSEYHIIEGFCGGLGTQARLGVGQRPTRRLRECNQDPPLKNG